MTAGDPTDPRAKEAALRRLRDASGEELAVFGDRLREDALKADATTSEVEEAEQHGDA